MVKSKLLLDKFYGGVCVCVPARGVCVCVCVCVFFWGGGGGGEFDRSFTVNGLHTKRCKCQHPFKSVITFL